MTVTTRRLLVLALLVVGAGAVGLLALGSHRDPPPVAAVPVARAVLDRRSSGRHARTSDADSCADAHANAGPDTDRADSDADA